MLPLLFTSAILVSDSDINYAWSENLSEKEQKEERESKEKEGVDGLEEYMLEHQYRFLTIIGLNSRHFSKNNEVSNISGDVITPPPEFS